MDRRFPRLSVVTGLALGLGLASVPAQAQQTPPPEPRPFRPAVEAGEILFLAGEIGAVPKDADPEGAGYEAAVHDAMDRVGKVLASRGLGYGDVVKCTAMLEDINKWARFNRVYATYFPADKLPARSAFGSVKLAFNAPIEVDCIARLKPGTAAK